MNLGKLVGTTAIILLTGCTMLLTASSNDFTITEQGKSSPVLVENNDEKTVKVAVEHFVDDVKLVSGVAPETISKLPKNGVDSLIIVGTLGKSVVIERLVESGKISVDKIKGKWEAFQISVINNPFPKVKKALVIAGPDRRGTAYGVFDVSKRIGVSPWYWWADIHPAKKEAISVTFDNYVEGEPSVKYRGIFLNDEDWGLKPWAAKKNDTDIRDIGPKTYAKIFELLLRLKANFIWPAMHPCTKAFYYYQENPKVADKYGIVVGASHCEPMLRNNVDEWKKNFAKEYGKKPGPWRYDINRDEIYKYWDDRVKESGKYENVYTIGMRGIHDGSMPGGKSFEDKIRLMDQVIADQRDMFTKHINKDASQVPQIFCPYKEVLKLYEAGVKVPEDVTLVWPDDNHGYIRNLSTPEEQRRSGGSGIYYHLSYWGSPSDYLWLSSISPALISYEMSKAYAYGNDRLWVFNVGDIKPAELEMEFALEMARDVKKWSPEKSMGFVRDWAERMFGGKFADRIAEIKKIYYELGHECKPEHLLLRKFTDGEIDARLAKYAEISAKAEKLYKEMPANRKDAFYQLILYPVKGAYLMNRKHLYANKAGKAEGKVAEKFASWVGDSFENIKKMTTFYNKEMSGGKWDHMMSWRPRGLRVFNMPQIGNKKKSINLDLKSVQIKKPVVSLPVAKILSRKDGKVAKWREIDGLGIGGRGLTTMPFTSPSLKVEELEKAPKLEFEFELGQKSCELQVKCLPTHRIHKGRGLRYAVQIDGGEIQVVDVNSKSKSAKWYKNVIRGFSVGASKHQLKAQKKHQVQLYLLDAGMVINQVDVVVD